MKHFLWAFILVLISTLVFSGEPDKKLHEMGLYPTVKLTFQACECAECMANPEESQAIGSGVIIRSEKSKGPIFKDKYINTILTAAHNIEHINPPLKIHVGKYKDWSELEGFNVYEGIVYAKNTTLDIAIILFVTDEKMIVAKLDVDKKLYLGEAVIRFGFGMGDDIRFDEGKITGVKTILPKSMAGMVRMNAHTIVGDSGGPVYDSDYNVIGITHAIRVNGMNLLTEQSYFSPTRNYKIWNEASNNSIGFVYKAEKMPNSSLFELWLSEHQIIGVKK